MSGREAWVHNAIILAKALVGVGALNFAFFFVAATLVYRKKPAAFEVLCTCAAVGGANVLGGIGLAVLAAVVDFALS